MMPERLILVYFKARYFGLCASMYVYTCCTAHKLTPDRRSRSAAVCGLKTRDSEFVELTISDIRGKLVPSWT